MHGWRWVYSVEARERGEQFGESVPLLGVHGTLKDARRHFDLIKGDRLRRMTQHWEIQPEVSADDPTRNELRRTYLTNGEHRCEIVMRRWRV